VVELDCDVDQLVGILTSQDQRYLSDGYIVTDNGRYLGLGTGDQLVRAVTETRIEAARHANPLTFLPGNIPISLHIQRLLESGTEFVACYADLNHFKPFNDHYGYWRGDQMIRLVARLAGALRCARDFVGHVGGDDFMLIFQSSNWLQRCKNIVDEFAREAVRCLTTAHGRQAASRPRTGMACSGSFRARTWPLAPCASRPGASGTPKKWPTWLPWPSMRRSRHPRAWRCMAGSPNVEPGGVGGLAGVAGCAGGVGTVWTASPGRDAMQNRGSSSAIVGH
jgi:diguanylate cyclase (GGDEF)-like protein